MEQEQEQLDIDDRIANLQAIIQIAEYEIAQLLKQKEYKPVGFIIGQKEEGPKKKKKSKK